MGQDQGHPVVVLLDVEGQAGDMMRSFAPTANEVRALREELGISMFDAAHVLRRRNMEMEILQLSGDETLTPNEERLLSLIHELLPRSRP
jgi:hypothetical protein